jgi:hypothetical protein
MTKQQALKKARKALAAQRALNKADEKLFQDLKAKFEHTKSYMLEQAANKELAAQRMNEEATAIRQSIQLLDEQIYQ